MLWVVRFVKILSLYHFLAFFRGNIWTIISISEIKISQLNAISFHDFLWSTPGRQPSMAKPRVLAGKREKPWKSVKIASFNLSNGTWFFQFTRCFFWWFVWWSLLVKIGYTQTIIIIIIIIIVFALVTLCRRTDGQGELKEQPAVRVHQRESPLEVDVLELMVSHYDYIHIVSHCNQIPSSALLWWFFFLFTLSKYTDSIFDAQICFGSCARSSEKNITSCH